MQVLTIDRLRTMLEYDPLSGLLTWKARGVESFGCSERERQRVASRWNLLRAGRVAGCLTIKGYRVLCIEGRNYPAHRIAWGLSHGQWPKDQIDHVNHNKDDNRLSNLRAVNAGENCRNRPLSKNNSSGQVGVHFHRRNRRWVARAMVDGRRMDLGSFTTREAAVAARAEANSRLGFHTNHGAN